MLCSAAGVIKNSETKSGTNKKYGNHTFDEDKDLDLRDQIKDEETLYDAVEKTIEHINSINCKAMKKSKNHTNKEVSELKISDFVVTKSVNNIPTEMEATRIIYIGGKESGTVKIKINIDKIDPNNPDNGPNVSHIGYTIIPSANKQTVRNHFSDQDLKKTVGHVFIPDKIIVHSRQDNGQIEHKDKKSPSMDNLKKRPPKNQKK